MVDEICILSQREAARLEHFGIWPECKYHLHTKRNKLVDKHYKLIQCIDGTTIPFAAPFDATETFGWVSNEMMRMMENNAFANRFKPVHARRVRPTMLAHRPGVTEADQAMWK